VINFTDIFVHRSVLASVVSLLILVVGLRALLSLEVRQYPATRDSVVTVTTAYPGASSALIQGFITTPLQQAIAQADGIDYLSSSSRQGVSVIEAHMRLNYDPNAAVAEIQAKVASQRGVLPEEAEDPVIDVRVGDRTALMYLAFYSDVMTAPQITDYLLRVVQPKLQAVEGVGRAELLGRRRFAMRIWLDPDRMAGLGVSAEKVTEVLRANNYLSSAGKIQGRFVAIDLSATTDVASVKAFRHLVVGKYGKAQVYLEDVATLELGAEDYDSINWFQGREAVFMAIEQAPGANPLEVAERVHRVFGEILKVLPQGLKADLPYDASEYIEDSIREVVRTLAEAVIIVVVVIFLFLGSGRAALVPAVAVPLSLIGGAFLMLLAGFSLNLLTLLAMVLAIGLVVDDAIVVVENVHRHIEAGETPIRAALLGARELGLPILAMTTTLIAVYAPIGFMGGLVGTLFTEFAFTLAGAVLVSGVVALTLSPMLSARVLKPVQKEGRFERLVGGMLGELARRYRALLHRLLEFPFGIAVFSALVVVSLFFMFQATAKELAPVEDQSILFVRALGPQTATLDYNRVYVREMLQHFREFPEYRKSFFILGFGGQARLVFGGFKMPPPSERRRSQMELQPLLQEKVNQVAGLRTVVFPRPTLPGSGGGLAVQFVITTSSSYDELDRMADELLNRARGSGLFAFLQKSIEIDRPRITLVIDRALAGDLGISMRSIGQSLSAWLGEGYVNRFNLEGRSYKVIPRVPDLLRANPSAMEHYHLETAGGRQVPLSAVVSLKPTVEPGSRTQFQQQNSVTLEGLLVPGVTLGKGLAFLEDQARDLFTREFGWDTTGQSRQYVKQGSSLVVTFFLSLLVIYLVLAAQFESWRDPFVILMSVPVSLAGALAFLMWGVASLNIYTQVGLITLIGLTAKNGILIVEFANQLRRRQGLNVREAVERAAAIRLRPVLMTTVSLLVGVIPLLTASGPGAVSRFDIGLVVASGLGIGTLFTLFVVPAFYVILAGREVRANGEIP